MTQFSEPFYLKNLKLRNNIFYAPIAGVSDLAYRRMSHLFEPGLQFCEMVKMEALIRKDSGTYDYLTYDDFMHPIGAQICGSNPKLAKEAAKIIEDLGFDVLDLNCGCPAPKITKDGSGSAMLHTPEKIGEILSNMVQAVKIPVTVKVRLGWNQEKIVVHSLVKIAEDAGASLITIHGRTKQQGYSGKASWLEIKECKALAKTIKVFGNGDVVDAQSAHDMFSTTNCDGIMVARGTFGKPYLAQEIKSFYAGNSLKTTLEESLNYMKQHFEKILEVEKDKRALFSMKRVGCYYLKGFPGAKKIREKIMKSTSAEEVLIHLP
jgi:nifR3 family TIM-barrel protein